MLKYLLALGASASAPYVGWYVNAQGDRVLANLAKLDKERVTHVFMADRKPTVSKAWNWECRIPRRGHRDSGSWHGVSAEENFYTAMRGEADKYGFKIMLMLGGWGGSNYYSYCMQPENRAVFVKSIVDYLEEWQLDGVDFDYEHPGLGGPCDHSFAWPQITQVRKCKPNEPMKFGTNCHPLNLDPQCCTKSGWMCVPGVKPRGFCWFSQGIPQTSEWGDSEETPDDSMCDFVNHIGGRYRGHYSNDWTTLIETIEETKAALLAKSPRYEVSAAVGVSGMWEGCEGRVDGLDAYRDYKTNEYTLRGGSVPCDRPDIPRLCNAVDHLGLMVYDIWGVQYPFTDHHAPFHCEPSSPMTNLGNFPFLPGDGHPCWPRYTMQTAVDWILNPFEPKVDITPDGLPHPTTKFTGGCAPEKITVGFPAYGKGVCGVPAGPDSTLPGLYQEYEPNTVCPSDIPVDLSWKNVSHHNYFQGPMPSDSPDNDGSYDKERRAFYTQTNEDGDLVGTYWYDHDNKFFMTLDTPDVIAAKTAWLQDKGVAGYFFWESTLDNWENEIGEAAYRGWTGLATASASQSQLDASRAVAWVASVILIGGTVIWLVVAPAAYLVVVGVGAVVAVGGILAASVGVITAGVVIAPSEMTAAKQWSGVAATIPAWAIVLVAALSVLLLVAFAYRILMEYRYNREEEVSDTSLGASKGV
ncbi:MAG: uncharacterized protein KVP18_003980 [Porospora cf. gigantea A]|uniref:uncharacterized protein n=1 Tax=Porospora cf. gigantea A TaxID=2853593 RepID=UPI00355A798C|nr:MAG: hypothetical protein KVP18_003980 [Porospora cf. gigantea A]